MNQYGIICKLKKGYTMSTAQEYMDKEAGIGAGLNKLRNLKQKVTGIPADRFKKAREKAITSANDTYGKKSTRKRNRTIKRRNKNIDRVEKNDSYLTRPFERFSNS